MDQDSAVADIFNSCAVCDELTAENAKVNTVCSDPVLCVLFWVSMHNYQLLVAMAGALYC